MTRTVALLRGINVGGHRVKNERLRALFQELGLGNAVPFLASGNVVFDAPEGPLPEMEHRIGSHLGSALGFPVATFLRSVGHLGEVVGAPVLSDLDDGVNPHVLFLRELPGEDLRERLRLLETPDDRFHVHRREVYWLRRGRLSDSSLFAGDLARATGNDTTMRNLNTLRRIVERFGD